jgi:hypothetical protein
MKGKTMLNLVQNSTKVESLPPRLHHCAGKIVGTPAPGARVSIDTPPAEAQRPYNDDDVLRYIERSQGLDWNLFGYVTVVERSDGSRVLINGQHRIGVVKKVDPSCQEVPAHIIRSDDPEYAARLFGLMNGVASRHLTREQLLWAEVLAKDKDALDTQRVLVAANLSCGKVNEDPDRRQVKRANFEKCMKFGVSETLYATQLLYRSYPDRDFDLLLSGLTKLLSMSAYADLSNMKKLQGQRFDHWFTNVFAESHSYRDATFPDYRNGQWYNGIAYGILKKFRHYMSRNDWPVVALDPIRSIYLKDAKEQDE